MMTQDDLKQWIRDIPDFPKEGIVFKDITTLLNNKDVFRRTIDLFTREFEKKDVQYIVAVESRGFIFGSALAYKLGAGLIPVRKKGKLPAATHKVSYALEYGTDTLEIHKDAFDPGARVLIVDDLLATGGTIKAVCELVKKMHAHVIGVAFLIELGFLKGKDKLKDLPVHSLIQF